MAALPLIPFYVPKVSFIPWVLQKLAYFPLLDGQEKQMTDLSRVDKRSQREIEEIKMDRKHRKGNQYAEVGEHLGMKAKHPQLGSKMGINTDGYFSLQ